MNEVKVLHKFDQDDYLALDMSIIGISVDRKQPDGSGLFSYSGRIIIALTDFPELTYSMEWLAYHKESAQQFLKTSPKWHLLNGDWHLNFNGRYGEVKVNGFEITDEDNEVLSNEAQHHLIHSVFDENYHWKKRVHETLVNHIKIH